MKKIIWQKCIQGSSASYPGIIPSPNDKVDVGMHVQAKYSDLDVHLQINEEIAPDIFAATVMYFEPVFSAPPSDLVKGDKVIIERGQIGWLFME